MMLSDFDVDCSALSTVMANKEVSITTHAHLQAREHRQNLL